jgi:hypothetical protein
LSPVLSGSNPNLFSIRGYPTIQLEDEERKKTEKEGEIGGKEMAIENGWKLRP